MEKVYNWDEIESMPKTDKEWKDLIRKEKAKYDPSAHADRIRIRNEMFLALLPDETRDILNTICDHEHK